MDLSSKWEMTEFQRSSFITNFMIETEMLDILTPIHDKLKTNIGISIETHLGRMLQSTIFCEQILKNVGNLFAKYQK